MADYADTNNILLQDNRSLLTPSQDQSKSAENVSTLPPTDSAPPPVSLSDTLGVLATLCLAQGVTFIILAQSIATHPNSPGSAITGAKGTFKWNCIGSAFTLAPCFVIGVVLSNKIGGRRTIIFGCMWIIIATETIKYLTMDDQHTSTGWMQVFRALRPMGCGILLPNIPMIFTPDRHAVSNRWTFGVQYGLLAISSVVGYLVGTMDTEPLMGNSTTEGIRGWFSALSTYTIIYIYIIALSLLILPSDTQSLGMGRPSLVSLVSTLQIAGMLSAVVQLSWTPSTPIPYADLALQFLMIVEICGLLVLAYYNASPSEKPINGRINQRRRDVVLSLICLVLGWSSFAIWVRDVWQCSKDVINPYISTPTFDLWVVVLVPTFAFGMTIGSSVLLRRYSLPICLALLACALGGLIAPSAKRPMSKAVFYLSSTLVLDGIVSYRMIVIESTTS